jgi:hypothetical protein
MSRVPDEWNDDGELFTALKDAVRAASDIPYNFIEMGKAAFTWRNVDAELAELTYDSARDDIDAPVTTRAEPAPLRALTFASPELTIELEVTDEALLGQLVPPQTGEIQIRASSGPGTIASIDEIGCFTVRPIPPGSFQLHCRTTEGPTVLTGWITL